MRAWHGASTMDLDGRDMRPLPLMFRRVKLSELVEAAGSPLLCFSEAFPDPQHLLAAARERGLRGIVSKLGLQPYVSGRNDGWISVTCRACEGRNQGSGASFSRRAKG
jgi:bifunctional non-homologous end joining protein LigD